MKILSPRENTENIVVKKESQLQGIACHSSKLMVGGRKMIFMTMETGTWVRTDTDYQACMANKHRSGTRGPRKLRQKSAKSPRHEFCGPSCFFYENYMTPTLSFFILRFFLSPACKIPVKPHKSGCVISRKEKSFHRIITEN